MDQIRAQYEQERALREKNRVESTIQRIKEFVKTHRAVLRYYVFFNESNKTFLVKMMKARIPYLSYHLNENRALFEFYRKKLYYFIMEIEKAGVSIYNREDSFAEGLINQFEKFREHNLQRETNQFKAIKKADAWNSLIDSEEVVTKIGWIVKEDDDYDQYLVQNGYQLLMFTLSADLSITSMLLNQSQEPLQIEYEENRATIKVFGSDIATTIQFNSKEQVDSFKNHYALVEKRKITELKARENCEQAKEIKLATTVGRTVEDLLNNPDVKTMGTNFLHRYFKGAFLTNEFFWDYETIMYELSGHKGKLVFHSDLRKTSLHELPDSLNMLIQTLDSIYQFDFEEIKVLSCWQLLYQLSKELYAREWQTVYGENFLNIHEMDFFSCLKAYCKMNIDVSTLNEQKVLGKFVYYLMEHNKFNGLVENPRNYLACLQYTERTLIDAVNQIKLETFQQTLLKNNSSEPRYTIDDIDLMSGLEFETFISMLFKKMGYATYLTKASGDQGIDVIAEKNSKKIGIQAKCYAGSVSNKAIQEVAAGLAHYQLDKGIVITNSFFTDSSRELAASNNIILWDREMLKEKINELF